jgi:hypothetical protein
MSGSKGAGLMLRAGLAAHRWEERARETEGGNERERVPDGGAARILAENHPRVVAQAAALPPPPPLPTTGRRAAVAVNVPP